jgi:hypothetical protein
VSAANWPQMKNDRLKVDCAQEQSNLVFCRVVAAMNEKNLATSRVGRGF